jgi:hypothetical protein
MCVVAYNRYVAICRDKGTSDKDYNSNPTAASYARLFSGGRVFIWIGLSWLFGIAIAIPSFHNCCRLIFDLDLYTWHYNPSVGGDIMSALDLTTTITVGYTVGICHYNLLS